MNVWLSPNMLPTYDPRSGFIVPEKPEPTIERAPSEMLHALCCN